ncbi:amidohydrolase family protein [Rhizobium sp. 2MFCol3.1]|uniref:amidohydrolase family protein n=1 Tax=Rhizobium sp. 2MFCol3.1 TaxID=1246459 RepID=UPI00036774C5|nr:amidohydrolase family protein [Rhizobium sp. 2MFCol3.1]
MIVDWHTNLSPPKENEHAIEYAKKISPTYVADPITFDQKVASEADEFVIITMNFPRLGEMVQNEFVAEHVQRHKGRAIGLACVDPYEPQAPKKLEHAIKEYGLRGLKCSPVYGGFDPWCEEAWALYEVCDRLNVPILWHQSAAYAQFAKHEYGSPTYLDKIARTFPKMKMIVAHLGQPWMEECVVLMRKHPQIYADLSARFHRKWQLYHGLMVALEYKVTDRLLFGSDFPLRSPKEAIDEFRQLNDWGPDVKMPRFPDEVIEDIIYNRPLSLIWENGAQG